MEGEPWLAYLPAAVAFPVRMRTWLSSSVIRRCASSATVVGGMEAPQLWHAREEGVVEGCRRIVTEDMSW